MEKQKVICQSLSTLSKNIATYKGDLSSLDRLDDVCYVDSNITGNGNGTYLNPYNTITNAKQILIKLFYISVEHLLNQLL